MFKFTNFTDGGIFHTSSATFRSMTSKGKTILKTGKTVQKIESPIKRQVESAVNLNLISITNDTIVECLCRASFNLCFIFPVAFDRLYPI